MTIKPLLLVVISIGNPGKQYINSRHSAGHFVLDQVRGLLGFNQFEKCRDVRKASISTNNDKPGMILYQSNEFMNLSGGVVRQIWNTVGKEKSSFDPQLLILHDELDLESGLVKYRPYSRKVNGHNGLRDIVNKLSMDTARISIGIDRPSDRSHVADYVLSRFDSRQKVQILNHSVPKVIEILQRIEDNGSLDI